MSEFTRRRLLAASGAVAAGAVAGCMGRGEEPEEGADAGDGDGDESASGTELRSITVENLAEEEHTVDVIVEFDDEVESWTSHDLDGRDGEDLDRDWPTESSDFRVQARLDGETVREVRPGTWNHPECLALTVVVDRSGDLDIWSAAGDDVCTD